MRDDVAAAAGHFVKRRALRVDFLLLTANPAETEAVREVFELPYSGPEPDIPYQWGRLTHPTDKGKSIIVALTWLSDEIGAPPALSRATDAVELLRPSYFVDVGITAGVYTEEAPLKLGDVVLVSFIRHGPPGRDGTVRERAIHQPSHRLRMAAEGVADEGEWKGALDFEKAPKRVREPACDVHKNGELVSADRFVLPYEDYVLRTLEKHPRTAAFEMEAGAIAYSLRHMGDHLHPPGLLFVKGISDLVYDKAKVQQMLLLEPNEREAINKRERRRWTPFASHAAAVYVRQLMLDLTTIQRRPANAECFWPAVGRRDAVHTNSRFIGLYDGVEPEDYSNLAAELLQHAASDRRGEHFFTVCAFSPRGLWEAIVGAARRRGRTPETVDEVYESAMEDFPHFGKFAKHMQDHPQHSGVRVLLLDGLDDRHTWLAANRGEETDVSKTRADDWKLFLRLNGNLKDDAAVPSWEQGVPCWAIDRDSLLRDRGRYRFNTDYVILGEEFLLDYYDESGILVASEVGTAHSSEYYVALRQLFHKLKRRRQSPFHRLEMLNDEVQGIL